ncbi:hypothetical protein ACIP6X_02535 [Streptomyces coeruleorubidus]|uniref:hypothetical protein n=1 Tax=Streptomyces coeruleorubidus TaxID=116188 RepID=UPI0038189C10
MSKVPPTSPPATPGDPAETVERVRRLAANWRLGYYEGDLGVAWDEAAIALLAVLENPNVTHYEIGFNQAATVRHNSIEERP